MLAVRWPGRQDRQVASGRAARKRQQRLGRANARPRVRVVASAAEHATASACTGGSARPHRPAPARRPCSTASAVPSRNRSASDGRSSGRGAAPGSSTGDSPRTTATGTPGSLPLTSSAAAATSSATATSVISSTHAVRVGRAAQVVDRAEAGDADGDVDHAGAPGPAHGVADDDGDVDAQRGAQRRPAAPRARGVRVDRQQGELAGAHVAGVHAGGGEHQALRVSRDPGPARRGDDPDGLLVDRGLPGRLPAGRVGRRRQQPALHLATPPWT